MNVLAHGARCAAALSLFAPLAWLFGSAGESPEARATRSVAEPFVEAALGSRDMDVIGELLAADVFFIDPTTAVWGSALAHGIRGREEVLATERDFGIGTVQFDVQQRFVSGRHAIFAGFLSWTSDGQPPATDVPFVTALRVAGERVVERRDWGDYDRIAGVGGLDGTEATGEVARAYLAAWAELDVDALGGLWSDDVVYVDATAPGTDAGERSAGPDELRARVAEARAAVLELAIEPELEIVSGHHAVTVGRVRFTLAGAALGLERERSEHEGMLVMALTIADGRVLRHRQYFDYEALFEELAELRAAESEAAGD